MTRVAKTMSTNNPTPPRVVIVEDHPAIMKGLTFMLERGGHYQVVGTATDGESGLRAVKELEADFILVDLSLPGSSGLELIRSLREMELSLGILVVSMHPADAYFERSLAAGADGFINKQDASEHLVDALDVIRLGGVYPGHAPSQPIAAAPGNPFAPDTPASPVARLSDREREVFEALGLGMTTRQIGNHLHISAKTVETHRVKVKAKLAVSSATALTAMAGRWMAHQGFDIHATPPRSQPAAATDDGTLTPG